MSKNKDIYDYSLSIFRPLVRKLEPILPKINHALKSANMSVSPEKYLAVAFLTFPIAFVAAVGFLFFYAYLIIPTLKPSNPIVIPLVALVIAFISSIVVIYYPKSIADKRRSNIDNTLIFATIYLSSISRSGFPPQEAFKMLSKFKEYKEIAIEASKITKDVEALGLDLPSALSRAVARSPSAQWTELLSGVRSGITTGGDVPAYLDEKARGLIAMRKRIIDEYSKKLSTLMQVYIGFIVVGASLFIVMSSLMSAMGGIPINTLQMGQYFGVLIGIPCATAFFIIMIKQTSPWK